MKSQKWVFKFEGSKVRIPRKEEREEFQALVDKICVKSVIPKELYQLPKKINKKAWLVWLEAFEKQVKWRHEADRRAAKAIEYLERIYG